MSVLEKKKKFYIFQDVIPVSRTARRTLPTPSNLKKLIVWVINHDVELINHDGGAYQSLLSSSLIMMVELVIIIVELNNHY